MSEKNAMEAEGSKSPPTTAAEGSPRSSEDEATTVAAGEVDPVYEKKAKVLNRAASPTTLTTEARKAY